MVQLELMLRKKADLSETCKRPRLKPFAMPSLCLPKSSTYSEEKKRIKEKNGAKRSARYEEINRKNEIFLSASEMPSTSRLITDTSNQQPCTSNQQPCTSNTSNQQPCTSNQQPCTSNQQPCTSNQQPCASNQMPDASIPMPSIPIEIPVNIPIETLFNSNVLPRISIDMLYLFEENEASSTVTPDEIIAVDALLDLRKIPDKLNKATQVCSGDLRTQHIIKADDLTDSQLSSLTGLRSLSLLNYLAKEVSAELNFNNKFQLPVRERIILSMMKMYLNLSFSSLAIFFGCTVKTACNIFGTVIPILSSIVGSLIEWPTKEEIVANCPKAFRFF